jgi:hypothetical protein
MASWDLRISHLTYEVSVLLGGQTLFNVLIACFSSTSDQAENASFASSIEHVHHLTVILPHRMQGMACPPARQNGAPWRRQPVGAASSLIMSREGDVRLVAGQIRLEITPLR